MNVQIMSYELNEEHLENPKRPIGVATILVDDKYIVRFKIVEKKEGNGFFVSSFSERCNGQYIQAFEVDSKIMFQQIEKLIRDEINKKTQNNIFNDKAPF